MKCLLSVINPRQAILLYRLLVRLRLVIAKRVCGVPPPFEVMGDITLPPVDFIPTLPLGPGPALRIRSWAIKNYLFLSLLVPAAHTGHRRGHFYSAQTGREFR